MTHRVPQKQGLLECGWWGNNMGVTIYSFNLNIVLQYDIVMLQNYMLMTL